MIFQETEKVPVRTLLHKLGTICPTPEVLNA